MSKFYHQKSFLSLLLFTSKKDVESAEKRVNFVTYWLFQNFDQTYDFNKLRDNFFQRKYYSRSVILSQRMGHSIFFKRNKETRITTLLSSIKNKLISLLQLETCFEPQISLQVHILYGKEHAFSYGHIFSKLPPILFFEKQPTNDKQTKPIQSHHRTMIIKFKNKIK